MRRIDFGARAFGRGRPPREAERGQALVLIVISLTVLLGFTAVAIDMGRFVSERRFLQNAADAAALAGADALTNGKTAAEIEAAARASLTVNFANEPTGRTPAQPSSVPIYEAGHTGEAQYMVEGILIGEDWVRVAIRNNVDFTFGRVFGLIDQEISARAHAGMHDGPLPIAVRQYIQAPGPEPGATSPCVHNERVFMSVFSTADTACLGSDTNSGPRSEPSAGAAFSSSNPNNDPANHGPIIDILGQGAAPSNAADFRGFIALDIRDFSSTTSQDYYNGAYAGVNENLLKDLEMQWILQMGYPGPGFPPVTVPPNPLDQVSILSGNSSALAVGAMAARYVPGDNILVTVYPGYVSAVPDFAIAQPPGISLPETGTVSNAGSFRVSRNHAFSGVVTLSTDPDLLDSANPLNLGTLTGSPPITYDPNAFNPALGAGTSVTMRNITTTAATPGIYALWVKGQAGSGSLTAKKVPLVVTVGTVTRDFTLVADAAGKVAQNSGDDVTFTLTLTNAPNKNTNFGGSVALSVDTPLPPGTGAISMSSSATPSRAGTTVSLTIDTGSLPQGVYTFVVRATGMNGDTTPRKVTHLLPLQVNVAPASVTGNQEYIDITGFAVMRITSIDANTVRGYAITPAIADQKDPRLRLGKPPRLLPW